MRIKVQACGICHSDTVVKDALFREFSTRECRATKWPALSMPSVSASTHGKMARGWAWAGTADYCDCDHCRRGNFFACVRADDRNHV